MLRAYASQPEIVGLIPLSNHIETLKMVFTAGLLKHKREMSMVKNPTSFLAVTFGKTFTSTSSGCLTRSSVSVACNKLDCIKICMGLLKCSNNELFETLQVSPMRFSPTSAFIA